MYHFLSALFISSYPCWFFLKVWICTYHHHPNKIWALIYYFLCCVFKEECKMGVCTSQKITFTQNPFLANGLARSNYYTNGHALSSQKKLQCVKCCVKCTISGNAKVNSSIQKLYACMENTVMNYWTTQFFEAFCFLNNIDGKQEGYEWNSHYNIYM